MSEVKFGFQHLSKPTPAGLNRTVRVATVITGIFLAWMNTDNLIGEHAQHVINSLGGLLLGLSNGIAPLFGIQVSDSAVIPASEVKSMENKP